VPGLDFSLNLSTNGFALTNNRIKLAVAAFVYLFFPFVDRNRGRWESIYELRRLLRSHAGP
jgi:hypothetical protein